MNWFEKNLHLTRDGSRSGIDAFTFFFSYYAAPIAIAALSVFVLVFHAEAPRASQTAPLPVRVLEDPQGQLDAIHAAARLGDKTSLSLYDTHRRETPIWFAVPTPAVESSNRLTDAAPPLSTAILFPSKHIRQMECFDSLTLQPVGRVSQNVTSSGDLMEIGSGVAALPGRHTELICKAIFSGPATLSAVRMSRRGLKQLNDIFHWRAGLLEGGLATLAAFVLITAIINRDWVYVLFAAWLFGNLRLGAISMGWDELWLGSLLPLNWISLIRKITVPVYYILTYTLFATLFRNDLARIGYKPMMRLIQLLGPVLLIASIALPVPAYLPLMWGIVSVGIVVVIFLLIRLFALAPSRTALWYSLALAIALLSSLSEVISAAFEKQFLIPELNSVTAALVSSLMAALAIAERIRAERAERLRAEAELRRAYNVTPVGLFTLAVDGEFTQYNRALETMLGMANAGTVAHWDDYFPAVSWEHVYQRAIEAGAFEMELSREGPIRATDDDTPVRDSTSGAHSSYGDVIANSRHGHVRLRHYQLRAARDGMRLECSLEDVTERHQATQTLNFLAEHDPLTGALNRRGIDRYNAQTEAAEDRSTRSLVVAYLDLDRFKLINDLFGHHIGDAILRQVFLRIETTIGSQDRVCRAGGDEFVILFQNTTLARAAVISQAIVDAIADKPYEIDHRAFHVRASLGLVNSPAGLGAEEAISAADSACREAKQEGNGRIVAYGSDAPIFDERARRISLLQQFSGDRPPPGLFLEMQPIMSMTTPYDALDFEVLLRMRGPDGAVIPPAKVISAAEANGTVSAIDKWVMETTLTWIDRNRARLSRTRFVSVNVSAASLNDERFVAEVGALFQRFRHVVPLLCIEITEGVALHDLNNTRRLIDNVQKLGAKVALDDFGAGYTSFPYLRDLPADALKVDGEFVKNIGRCPANAAIVEAIVGLARNLGMQSVAEWVEDASTLEILQEMGVDHVQGFAIARPQSPEVILTATSAADFITDPEILALIGPRSVWHSIGDNSLQQLQ